MSAASLLIELDSVHSAVLESAIELGHMPFLGSLVSSGSTAKLKYEIPLQVAAWMSLQSGQSAAQHQFISYDNPVQGTYKTQHGFGPTAKVHKYWDQLSSAGKRVLVLNNVMGTAPTEGINGVQVCGFSTHISGEYSPIRSSPSHYADELLQRFPNDLYHVEDWGSRALLKPERLVCSVCSNLQRKSLVFSEFMAAEHWDHVHIGLDDLHGVGHMLLHSIAEDVLQAGVEDAGLPSWIMETCSALDTALNQIISAAGPGVTVMLAALGGIDRENSWSHQLDPLLTRIEHGPGGRTGSLYNQLGGPWNKMPHSVKRPLLPLKAYLRERYLSRSRASARAFAVPVNEETGSIRLNVIGREPSGRVARGDEYERLCDELTRELQELHDVDTGIALVEEIVQVPHSLDVDPYKPSSLPDLLVVWSREKSIQAVSSKRVGVYERAFKPARMADHVVDGLLVANGPLQGHLPTECSVLDVAGTVLAMHEQVAPGHVASA
jgi:predicted AlkP superfamily phosphohydrolase/phosphomutase